MKKRLLLLILFLNVAGCELINGSEQATELFDPKLDLAETTLLASPSATQVAAYYCPQIIGDPITRILCGQLLGPPPPKQALQFHFELRYLIANPNNFPLPTTEILAAITVFDNSQNLGAVCVQLCNEGDPQCTGVPGENACKSSVDDIRTIDDLKDRVIDLLFATIDAAINGELDNFAVRVIPAGSENFEVRINFSLGIDAMIDIMKQLVNQLVDDFLAKKPVSLKIPFKVEGTVWFEAPLLGRVAIGYGPFADVWVIEP